MKRSGYSLVAFVIAVALWTACGARILKAQQRVPVPAPAGGDVERELRALQLLGGVPMRMWSIRAFNATEVTVMLAGTGDSFPARLTSSSHRWGRIAWHLLPTEIGTTLNTNFPYGFNDGPIWAGRGLTAFASAGIDARLGIFSARFNPLAFIAQNASFQPAVAGSFSLNTPYAESIDLPARFGTSSYGRFDGGESEVRIQTERFAAGISTASQVWGPAVDHPLILGNNAGGFPHAFAETARPLNFRVASLHARFIWGRLDGSAFGPPAQDDRQFVTAGVAAFSFPALSGLEVGAARFFHSPWPSNGLVHAPFFNVFQGILKSTLTTQANPSGDVPGDNQLASVFFRWAFPLSGVEVYGEYGREDHNANVRDFWEEIDHDAGFLIGLQRAWRVGKSTAVFRVEHLNTRIGKLHPVRIQAPWYVHGVRTQGHTQQGQALGSAGGFGGGGTVVALERYDQLGRITIRWDRLMRAEQLEPFEHDPISGAADVMHAIRAERSRTLRVGELAIGASGVFELNRDFLRDRFNLSTSVNYRFFR